MGSFMYAYWTVSFPISSRAKHNNQQSTIYWNINTNWNMPISDDVPSTLKPAIE